jgi:hypothetical protein
LLKNYCFLTTEDMFRKTLIREGINSKWNLVDFVHRSPQEILIKNESVKKTKPTKFQTLLLKNFRFWRN